MVFVFGEVGGEVVAMFVELGGGRGRAGSQREGKQTDRDKRFDSTLFSLAERYVGRTGLGICLSR